MSSGNLWTSWLHLLGTVICLHALQVTSKLEQRLPETNPQYAGFWAYPRVTVAIARPVGRTRGHVISVPLQAHMTVLVSFIHAAIEYRDTEPNQKRNPYNLGLEWDPAHDCYVVVQATNVENRNRRKWLITVFSERFIMYRGRCIPNEDEVILRPNNQVLLTFSRVKDHALSMKPTLPF